MKPTLPFSFSLILGCCLFGCSPQYLVPLDYTTEQDNYQLYIEADDIAYSMECVDISDVITFWLEVTNNSTDTIFINRSNIFSASGMYPLDKEAPEEIAQAMTAQQLDKFYTDKIKNANSLAVLAIIFGATLIVADIASDIKDSNKEDWDFRDENRVARRKLATELGLAAVNVTSEASKNAKISAHEQLRYLPSELFRKNYLAPGESHSGKIVFNKEILHNYYRIKTRADEKTLYFEFRRAKIKERNFIHSRSIDY